MTNMSCNILQDIKTRIKDFTWTHCASCLFNTAWCLYMLLLIGATTKQEKTYLKPAAHRFQEISVIFTSLLTVQFAFISFIRFRFMSQADVFVPCALRDLVSVSL